MEGYVDIFKSGNVNGMMAKKIGSLNIEKAWIVEAERRYQEYKEGKVQAISGDEVFRKIQDRLRK